MSSNSNANGDKKADDGTSQANEVTVGQANQLGTAQVESVRPVHRVLSMRVTLEMDRNGADPKELGVLKFDLLPEAESMVAYFAKSIRVSLRDIDSTYVKFTNLDVLFPRIAGSGQAAPSTPTTIPRHTLVVLGYSWFVSTQTKVSSNPWQSIATLQDGCENVLTAIYGHKALTKFMFITTSLADSTD